MEFRPWLFELVHVDRSPLEGECGTFSFPRFQEDGGPDEVEHAEEWDQIQIGTAPLADEAQHGGREKEGRVPAEVGEISGDRLAEISLDFVCKIAYTAF